jgi:predicted transposase YdaD
MILLESICRKGFCPVAVNVFDRTVKALARRYPEPFVKVALGYVEDLTVETIENPEVNLPERRLDFVYGLRVGEAEYILHLEFQLEHQAGMPERMFTYNALLTAAYQRPVISVVIYLQQRAYRRLPVAYSVTFQGEAINTFTYKVIRLWEYERAIAGGDLKELAPLLILLAEKGKEETALARARELILAISDEKQRADALSVAITVAARYFSRDFLFKFFKEETKMLQEASIVQDWINEGLEKGLERGRKAGKIEGEIEALQRDILEVLEERFGAIKKGIGKKLATVDDPAVLRSLHRRSIKVNSLEEFARLLEEV